MKKVAIYIDNIGIGGIPRAAISLMKELVNHADVTLILSDMSGELMSEIPSQVKVMCKPVNSFSFALKRLLKKGRVFSATKALVSHVWNAKIRKNWIVACENAARARGAICEEKYDVAIAMHGMNISQMVRVLHGLSADKKIAWIHGNHPFEEKDLQYAERIYKKFDCVFSDSAATTLHYTSDFSAIASKFSTVYNLFDANAVIEKGQEKIELFSSDYVNVVSVGRLSPEKGFDMIPRVAEQLAQKGYKVRFYIIGDGNMLSSIDKEIERTKTEEYVKLLGAMINPYPYMKACDIYLQPSYEESYGITMCEAGVLGSAIVCTEACQGITEKLRDGESVVVAPITAEGIAEKIELLINDERLREKLKENILKIDFSNKEEIAKILN